MSEYPKYDLYKVLGVSSDASDDEIKESHEALTASLDEESKAIGKIEDSYGSHTYREYHIADALSKRVSRQFSNVNRAYRVLSTERAQYDEWRANQGNHQSGPIDVLEGVYYDGERSNDYPHGKGKLYDENGSLIYDGEWKQGQYHGRGTKYYGKMEGHNFHSPS